MAEDLRLAAEAGFSAVHWCQHWNDDYIYTASEVRTIRRWLRGLGLRCRDLHASTGVEKRWGSPDRYAAAAGLDLLENRMNLVAELGGSVVVLHPQMEFDAEGRYDAKATFRKDRIRAMEDALPGLVRLVRKTGVRIAFENMPFESRLQDLLSRFLEATPATAVGVCYDAGHGNMVEGSWAWLERWKGRLWAVHLHDNRGRKDEHLLPFDGTVDWPRLMAVLAASAYDGPLTLELWRRVRKDWSPRRFLREAFRRGERLRRLGEA